MKNNSFNQILQSEISRRTMIGGLLTLPAISMNLTPNNVFGGAISKSLDFVCVPENMNDTISVPEGYEWHKLISWGDPLFEEMEAPKIQRGAPFTFTRAEQEKRFGMCNDMLAIFPKKYQYPWPEVSKDWIFCSNNEYVAPYLMITTKDGELKPTPSEIEALYAAQGVSVYEVRQDGASWSIVKNKLQNKALNRRITPFTEVVFEGAAKNHPWIKAAKVLVNANEAKQGNIPKNKDGILCGTMQNCAGGFTPWGTYLTAEENIDNMFFNANTESEKLKAARAIAGFEFDEDSFGYANRWKFGGPQQFDLAHNPHGPALYGWIVEIDPYDPNWAPRKRTALGRRKSECATCVITKSGQIATYSGDDQVNEFVYKFVSKGKFNPKNRIANRDLLNEGKLYAARFEENGKGHWIELTLAAANAVPRSMFETPFKDNADLLIRAREAARRLGATQMDRPEDVESPVDGTFMGKGSVYIVCTGNQSAEGISGNIANPRRTNGNNAVEKNYTGHIIRINEANLDHAATQFEWEFFLMGGDHSAALANGESADGETRNLSSWKDGVQITTGQRFAMPDNITFDNSGNAFFTTDGTADSFRCNDGVYAVSTTQAAPRKVKRFLTGPIGCEITGPKFSPDNKTFFCGLQHVGDEDAKGNRYRGKEEYPPSKFPNNDWPRDTIIYVTKKDGGII
jgi:uncharacterized protein